MFNQGVKKDSVCLNTQLNSNILIQRKLKEDQVNKKEKKQNMIRFKSFKCAKSFVGKPLFYNKKENNITSLIKSQWQKTKNLKLFEIVK